MCTGQLRMVNRGERHPQYLDFVVGRSWPRQGMSQHVRLACMEEAGVADRDRPGTGWRKSTASGGEACVEVATVDGWVLVRDSKDPTGPVLRFPCDTWSAFIRDLHSGSPETR